MNEQKGYRDEFSSYVTGYCLALLLSALPFAVIVWGALNSALTLWVIAVSGLVQVFIHFRYFLHIDLSKQKREDLQLVLFSALLFSIMVGGTIWIMHDLHLRMM